MRATANKSAPGEQKMLARRGSFKERASNSIMAVIIPELLYHTGERVVARCPVKHRQVGPLVLKLLREFHKEVQGLWICQGTQACSLCKGGTQEELFHRHFQFFSA